MNNLILRVENGQPVVTSRQIAEDFEKRHNDVVRTIEEKIKTLTTEKFTVTNLFIPSTFNHNGNEYKGGRVIIND